MSRPASKFSGLLSAVQAPPSASPEPAESAAGLAEADGSVRDTSVADPLPDPTAVSGTASRPAGVPGTRRRPAPDFRPDVPPADAAPRRRGRPAGKRSDPDFDQVTAYIRRQTYRDVRIALLTQGRGQEFSELVEDLLAGWLRKQR